MRRVALVEVGTTLLKVIEDEPSKFPTFFPLEQPEQLATDAPPERVADSASKYLIDGVEVTFLTLDNLRAIGPWAATVFEKEETPVPLAPVYRSS